MIIAALAPAPCDKVCGFCRSKDINRRGDVKGDLDSFITTVKDLKLGPDDVVFLSSTGDMQNEPNVLKLIDHLIANGVKVRVCCTHEDVLRPGLAGAEISHSKWQNHTSLAARKKARDNDIPYAITTVNYGQLNGDIINFQAELLKLDKNDNPDGIIIRKVQDEGGGKTILAKRAEKDTTLPDKTTVWQRDNSRLEAFPIACYGEFDDANLIGVSQIYKPNLLINNFGQIQQDGVFHKKEEPKTTFIPTIDVILRNPT